MSGLSYLAMRVPRVPNKSLRGRAYKLARCDRDNATTRLSATRLLTPLKDRMRFYCRTLERECAHVLFRLPL